MDLPIDLEEVIPQRKCLDTKEIVDFIERDCHRIMSRINEIGDSNQEGDNKYTSPVLCFQTTMESFKNEYRKIERDIRWMFHGKKIKSIKFESCLDGDCGIRYGTGSFVIEY